MSDHAGVETKTIKVSGPDHPISIERNAHRVVVKVGRPSCKPAERPLWRRARNSTDKMLT
jgi:hypothetical protein